MRSVPVLENIEELAVDVVKTIHGSFFRKHYRQKANESSAPGQ